MSNCHSNAATILQFVCLKWVLYLISIVAFLLGVGLFTIVLPLLHGFLHLKHSPMHVMRTG